ncbi:MAG: hypothetical protein IPJ65_00405 [Archangiaceae bacterium]|nr:hypothetical protein [Archangiaceae bacterium]
MKRAWFFVLLAAGCGASPDDLFVIGGRVVSRLGAGLDGVPVTVTRTLSAECGDGQQLHQQRTADGGLFSFDLLRVEVSPFYRGGFMCTRLGTGFEASGTTVWSDFYAFPNALTLPDFNDWSPGFSVAADGGVQFEPVVPEGTSLEPCAGNFPARETVVHAIRARVDGGLWWEQSDHQSALRVSDDGGVGPSAVGLSYLPVPLELPPEVLEDRAVELNLEAQRLGCVKVAGNGAGPGLAEPYEVVTRWSSTEKVLAQGHTVPVSRGARCLGLSFNPCPLTDGSPAPFELPETTNNLRLRLPYPAAVRVIVLRGAEVETGASSRLQLTIRSGDDTLTVQDDTSQVALDSIVFIDAERALQRDWRRIVLPRPMQYSDDIELELNRNFVRLGEVSLFE